MITRAEVVAWAERLTTQGTNEPAVLRLAATSVQHADGVDELLIALAQRYGLGELTDLQAGRLAAADVARRLNDDFLRPIDAAREMWRIARRAPASEPLLRPYIGLASEWDDDPQHRDAYDQDIRSLALVTARWLP